MEYDVICSESIDKLVEYVNVYPHNQLYNCSTLALTYQLPNFPVGQARLRASALKVIKKQTKTSHFI